MAGNTGDEPQWQFRRHRQATVTQDAARADGAAQLYDEARDAAGVAALWRRVFGVAKGGQTPQWLFRTTPAGPPPRVVIREDGQVVAHAGAIPVRFVAADQPMLGAWSVGAMTHPQLRGRGLFVQAGQALYAHMTDRGFDMVGGFSNAQSVRLHTGALQRRAVRPFPWCVRPLLPRRLGLLPSSGPWPAQRNLVIAGIEPGDSRIDAIWQQRPIGALTAVRDAAWSAWRYGGRADAGYRMAVAMESGQPKAWLAIRLLTVARVPALFVVDLQCTRDGAAAAQALLCSAEQLASQSGCLLSSALLPGWGPLRPLMLRRGYVPVPEALHPQSIVLSTRALSPRGAAVDWADPKQWWLAWSDTDVV